MNALHWTTSENQSLVLSLAFCPRNTYFVGSNRHDHKTGDQQLHNCYCSSCTFHGQGRPIHIQSSSFCSQLWKKRENVGTFSMSAIPPRRPIWKFWCDFPSPPKVADKVVDMVADEKEKEKKGHAKKKNKRYPIWWESWSRGWLIGPKPEAFPACASSKLCEFMLDPPDTSWSPAVGGF